MRPCEVCGTPVKHHQRRTCSRACGFWISRATVLAQPVPWSSCLVCDHWYVGRRGAQNTYLGATCSPVCAQQARTALAAPKATTLGQPQTCLYCDTTFTNQHTTIAVYCSRHCSRKMHKQRRRTRDHSSTGVWRWSDFMVIARRHNYCCAYCGTKPTRLDPDHVVPVSRGGDNIIGNLLPCCPACNSSKRDLSLTEWADYLHQRGLPPRATTWDHTDPRYAHLTSVIERAA